MANTYNLGGSPLGLINVKSRPDRNGFSTFNGGKSRNINVASYNRGKTQPAGVKINGTEAYAPVSLLTGGSFPNFWPNADIGKLGSEEFDKSASGIRKDKSKADYKEAKGIGISATFHNDASYDTSLLNVIEKLSKTKAAALRPQDFAYCKFLGVYPNNRLMIARRFPAPTKDNIFGKAGSPPKAILISWKPETEDFLEFSFGEEWVDADADFTNVLNKLGKDFGIDNSGQGLSKAINLIPLPGFTEQLQREILVSMGVLDSGSLGSPLPSGNPNLIKMAKRRKTIGYGEAGAGLKCTISVKMDCEYEQKFISGIDPSTAWQDILNNIMIFGTSNSTDYGLSSSFEANLSKWMDNPGILVKQVIAAVSKAVTYIKDKITEKAAEALKTLNESINPQEDKRTGPDKEKANKSLVDKAAKQLTKFFDKIIAAAYKTISKYKVEIIGIANALSGSPSTPWHITLGNPIRPFFCSGDMYVSQDVTVKFGPQLAFNDLPSSIKVSFTLSNARPLGMQEILAKFNMGSIRTVNIKKDFLDTDLSDDETKVQGELDNWVPSYFDGAFAQNGSSLVPQPVQTQTSTPEVFTNSSAGVLAVSPNTEFAGNVSQQTAALPIDQQYAITGGPNGGPVIVDPNQTGLSGSNTIEVFVVSPPATPGGEPVITTETKTLKDNGDVVTSLDPQGAQLTNVDLSSSLFAQQGGIN